jgi:hypothetical protein
VSQEVVMCGRVVAIVTALLVSSKEKRDESDD